MKGSTEVKMPWHRRKKTGFAQEDHFVDPSDRCLTCGDQADAVVMGAKGSRKCYCQFCIIIVTSEWSVDDGR